MPAKVFVGSDSPCDGCKMIDAFEKGESVSFDLSGAITNKHYEVTSQPLTNENGATEGLFAGLSR